MNSVEPAPYTVLVNDDETIARALSILSARVNSGPVMASPQDVKNYLILRAANLQHELISVMYLDAQHALIDTADLFRGTLTQAAVYPREVVKVALSLNAAAIILTHNHPSGKPEPSRADEQMTQALKAALALIDVKLLDHIVTGGGACVSFAERGLL